jgi:transposase
VDAWIYERQDQVSFLDGHVRAFAHFGGVPAGLAYDNLKAAVVRIMVGGERTLTPRFALERLRHSGNDVRSRQNQKSGLRREGHALD